MSALDTRAARMRQAYLVSGPVASPMEWDKLRDTIRDQWRAVAGVDAGIGWKLDLTAEELYDKRVELGSRWTTIWQDDADLLAFIQSRIVAIPAPDYCPADVAFGSRVPELEREVERLKSHIEQMNSGVDKHFADLRSALHIDESECIADTARTLVSELNEVRQELAGLKSRPAAPSDAQIEALARAIESAYSKHTGRRGCKPTESLEDYWYPEARAAYDHIAAQGGLRANVTEAEIAEAINTGYRKLLLIPPNARDWTMEAAAVMALLRERGVVDSALQAELEAKIAGLQARNDNQKQQLLELDRHISPFMTELSEARTKIENQRMSLRELHELREKEKRNIGWLEGRLSVIEKDRDFYRTDYAAVCKDRDASKEELDGVVMQRDSYRIQLANAEQDLAELRKPTTPRPVKVRFDVTPEELADKLHHAQHGGWPALSSEPDRTKMMWVDTAVLGMHYLAAHAGIDIPEGVPSAAELGKLGIDVYGQTGDHEAMGEAILAHLAPYLKPKPGQPAPDICPATLERLAEIACGAWRPADGPKCWRAVVLAVLAAAKLEVDAEEHELLASLNQTCNGLSTGQNTIQFCNSRIRYGVRVPRAEVEALAKVAHNADARDEDFEDSWATADEPLRDDYRRIATAAFRHFGMEVENA